MVEDGMFVSVEGQHGDAVGVSAVDAAMLVQAGNAQQFAIGRGNAGWHRLAAAPVGLVDRYGRDDAVLRLLPRTAEWLAFRRPITTWRYRSVWRWCRL